MNTALSDKTKLKMISTSVVYKSNCNVCVYVRACVRVRVRA